MLLLYAVLVSIVVSIPACHAGDRGSIPRRGDYFFVIYKLKNKFSLMLIASDKICQKTRQSHPILRYNHFTNTLKKITNEAK